MGIESAVKYAATTDQTLGHAGTLGRLDAERGG